MRNNFRTSLLAAMGGALVILAAACTDRTSSDTPLSPPEGISRSGTPTAPAPATGGTTYTTQSGDSVFTCLAYNKDGSCRGGMWGSGG